MTYSCHLIPGIIGLPNQSETKNKKSNGIKSRGWLKKKAEKALEKGTDNAKKATHPQALCLSIFETGPFRQSGKLIV